VAGGAPGPAMPEDEVLPAMRILIACQTLERLPSKQA
jgi:hypothetical protein